MDNSTQSRRKRHSKARERANARRQRRQAMVSIRDESLSRIENIKPKRIPSPVQAGWRILRDTLWYIIHRTPALKIGAGLLAVVVVLFGMSLFFRSDIGPNIWALDVPLGGMSIEEAESALLSAWNDEFRIQVMMDGETVTAVRPSEIGLILDAYATALSAKEAGLAGFPFGHEVDLVVETSYPTAQNFMLNLADRVYVPAQEASYAWDNGQVRGILGSNSRELDVTLSVQRIFDDPMSAIRTQRVDLLTTATPPRILDPTPYLDDAQRFVEGGYTLVGYDPFRDEEQIWELQPDELVQWLQAGENRLIVKRDGMEDYIENINLRLANENVPRYLDENEIAETIEDSILADTSEAMVRIRYTQRTYTVVSGDSGFLIGYKTGLPFGRIQTANPSVDWNSLYVGQEIVLPSRDLVVPEQPVINKRIVVDLDRLWLVAYENDEMVFHWAVSSGMSQAPTSPGIYQILDKSEVAYGSSFSLCNGSGDCGQWEMDYFMSIYEVAPGLMNGFHGAVLLPNGRYLNGGSGQQRSTFGCVMSDNEQARMLYEWAEVGTVVEIVSPIFPPESQTAQEAMNFIDTLTGEQASIGHVQS
jgi:LysM repeat protein